MTEKREVTRERSEADTLAEMGFPNTKPLEGAAPLQNDAAPLVKAPKEAKTLAVPPALRAMLTGGDLSAIQAALPAAMKPRVDDFVRVALVDIPRNQALAKVAEQNPASIVVALLDCARVGLRPGVLGEAYLVPYGQTCQAILGYRGLQKLAMASGLVRSVEAQCVYEADDCEITQGDAPSVRHVPSLDAERDEAHCRGAYVVADLMSGQRLVEWMSKAEIARIRGRSRASGNGPWVSDWTEMARKTVIRRLAKRLPMPDDFAPFDRGADVIESQPVDVQADPTKRALTYGKVA